MKKLLLLLALASVGCWVQAAEQSEAFILTLQDASVVSVVLDDIHEITFNETATSMIIHKLDNTDIVIVLDNLDYGEFGSLQTTSLKSFFSEQDNVQKIIEDGHIYIVKDGVRYNVLGIRFN